MKIGLKKSIWIDSIVIILNISVYMTVLPSVVFGAWPTDYHQLFILAINTLYLIQRGKIYFIKITKENFLIYTVIFSFLLIFILEIPRYIISDNEGTHILKTLLRGSNILAFLLILCEAYSKYKSHFGEKISLSIILKSYFYFCLVLVALSDAVFLLWVTGLIDVFSNPIPENFSAFIDSNSLNQGTKYYFPLNITIVTDQQRAGSLANFMALSHEPHIATHLLSPAVFMLYGFNEITRVKKILYTTLFILFFIIAASATNIIALLIVSSILIFILTRYEIRRTIYILLASIIALSLLPSVVENISIFLIAKLTATGGSADYSKGFLEHVISPKNFWGDGVFNPPYPNSNVDDIGLIFSFLVAYFYLFGIIATLKLILKKEPLIRYSSCAALYFFLHSAKVTQLIFIFPYTIFILFLVLACSTLLPTRAKSCRTGGREPDLNRPEISVRSDS